MKTCTKCGELKPLTEYQRLKTTKDKLQSWCKQCFVDRTRFKKTGCTPEIYNNLYIKQQGCCAICNTHSTELNKALSADHCHTTGKIRGLLCTNCNHGLGKFKDSVSLLQEAQKYLETNNGTG